jgi:hypothetical protein
MGAGTAPMVKNLGYISNKALLFLPMEPFFTDIKCVITDNANFMDRAGEILKKYDKSDILNRMHVLMYYMQEDYKKIKNAQNLEIIRVLGRVINACEKRQLYLFTVDELIEVGKFKSDDPAIMNIVKQAYANLLDENGIVTSESHERHSLMTRLHHAFVKDEDHEVFYEIRNDNDTDREIEEYPTAISFVNFW